MTPPYPSSWRQLLVEYIANEAQPQEKFGHQPRLYALTQLLGEDETYDDDVVFAACWLHDLGVFIGHRPENPVRLKHWNNVSYAMQRAPAILKTFGFPEEKIIPVLECIRTHQPAFTPETIEATLLRDADILEQIGAVGILRTVCKVGRDTRFRTFTDAVTSLLTAIETLPSRLLLPRSKALAEERLNLHRAFLEATAREAGHLLL